MRLLRCSGIGLALLGLFSWTGSVAADRVPPKVEVRAPREVRAGIEDEARRFAQSVGDSSASPERGLAWLAARLLDEGCLEATLRLIVAPTPGGTPVLSIDSGAIAAWDTLIVTTSAREDSAESGPSGAARPFDPRRAPSFSAPRFERAMWEWIRGWNEAGFPFAVATVESLRVRDGRVWAGLRLDPGRRETVTELALEGKRGTRRSFLERWLRFRAGEPFRQSRLEDRVLRLERTGLFTRVDEPRVERQRSGGVRVAYPVVESPRNRAVGVVGYAAQNRTVTGLAELDLGNLGGAGRSIGVRWARPRPSESRFRLEYRELLLPLLPLGGRLALEQEVRDSTYSLLVSEGSIEAPLSWDWSARAGLEYQKASLGIEPAEQHRRLSTLVGMRWEGERRGEWRGGRFDLAVRSGRDRARAPSGRSLGSTRLSRGDLDGEGLVRLKGRGAARLRILAGAVTGADTLPASELYRVGGAGQLRGHPEAGFTTRRFVIGQFELGARSGESWAYLFTDLGALHGPGARDPWRWRSGFGVGLNPRVGSGDVSLDFAFPGALRFGEARIHLRVASRF